MGKDKGTRSRHVALHLSREQKASLEVSDPKGFKIAATSQGISYVTWRCEHTDLWK